MSSLLCIADDRSGWAAITADASVGVPPTSNDAWASRVVVKCPQSYNTKTESVFFFKTPIRNYCYWYDTIGLPSSGFVSFSRTTFSDIYFSWSIHVVERLWPRKRAKGHVIFLHNTNTGQSGLVCFHYVLLFTDHQHRWWYNPHWHVTIYNIMLEIFFRRLLRVLFIAALLANSLLYCIYAQSCKRYFFLKSRPYLFKYEIHVMCFKYVFELIVFAILYNTVYAKW